MILDRDTIEQLERSRQDPGVKRNRNNGKIVILSDFNCGKIENVKLIATPDAWQALQARAQITFDTLSSHIRLFQKNISALSAYAEQWPDDFAADVWRCAQAAAGCARNVIPRGGSPYELNRSEMWQVKTAARQVYVHLRLLKFNKPRGWRDKIEHLKTQYGVTGNDLRPLVMAIIQHELGFTMDTSRTCTEPDPCQFHRKYIHAPSVINWMKNSTRIKTGDTPFLKRIFPKEDV